MMGTYQGGETFRTPVLIISLFAQFVKCNKVPSFIIHYILWPQNFFALYIVLRWLLAFGVIEKPHPIQRH